MNKSQFYHYFWSQFGWPAYDESTVPERGDNETTESSVNEALLPYITYMVVEDEFEHPVYPNASLWAYGTSWATISQKAEEIAEYIGIGGKIIQLDSGLVWVQRGHPFAQRVKDDKDTIRRIIINIDVEFFTQN